MIPYFSTFIIESENVYKKTLFLLFLPVRAFLSAPCSVESEQVQQRKHTQRDDSHLSNEGGKNGMKRGKSWQGKMRENLNRLRELFGSNRLGESFGRAKAFSKAQQRLMIDEEKVFSCDHK
jgi:hypothetical protein